MNRVGFLYHPDFLKHDTGPGHPERPGRLSHLVNHLLGRPVWNVLVHMQPRHAGVEHVTLVHPEDYVAAIAKSCEAGVTVLDAGDTHACKDSYEVAMLAVGAVTGAVEQVLSGSMDSAFCAVRPPGHHAETATAMGFCLFNNVAIAARYAQKNHHLKRIAILDWDVHHGNGTQEIFYEDPTVLYVSLHQYPFYPGTGAEGETGSGKGKGFTINCPLKAGSGEKEYLDEFHQRIIPALDHFQPQLLILSAGFDAHRDDPLAGMNLTEGAFAGMTRIVKEAAKKHCGGKILSVLEGGYDLDALARSVETHLEILTGDAET